MIKRVLSAFVIFFILTSAYSEDNYKSQPIYTDEYSNKNFTFTDPESLESSYWIKQCLFSQQKAHDCNIEFCNEFIFLSGLRYLEIETVWIADYIESTDKYILDSSLVSIKGEFSYTFNEQGNMENDFYTMRIVDNKLLVFDKVSECEAIYICRDKSLY